jgi:N-methylhydantoinase B
MFFHMIEDSYVTSALERTRTAPWGLEGGGEARPNGAAVRYPDGKRKEFGKATRLLVPSGATLELTCGGGGGYGPPSERDPDAVLADLREGYVSDAHARRFYPHALEP